LRYFLDTNCCIYLIAQSRPLLTHRVVQQNAGDIGISAIVAAELTRGLASGDQAGWTAIDRFFRTFPVRPFGEEAARAFTLVPFRRAKFDRLIAAHALAMRLTLITANAGDFTDVAGLAVEDWTK
jgi:tRNA(fMet)-specific endonuclease VapC